MQFTNTTEWQDHFLRRMVSWCCKELGYPVRKIKRIRFRNKTHGYSGRCWHDKSGCRIVCSISKCNNPVRDLVNLTAHEIRHAVAELHGERTRGTGWRVASSEKVTCHDADKVEAAFVANEEALTEAWSNPPVSRAKPKVSVTEKRAAAAQSKLAEWQKKAKLAATKIKKYKAKVRYYERYASLAATRGETE